jgi:hypothetical protein
MYLLWRASFNHSAWASALEVVFGALIALWVTFFLEAVRRPDLIIKLVNGGTPDTVGILGQQALVARLQVVNRALPPGFGVVGLNRDAATQASGTITFFTTSGMPVFATSCLYDGMPEPEVTVDKMPIRWAGTPQPHRAFLMRAPGSWVFKRFDLRDPERLTTSQTIRPGLRDGVMEVALSFPGDDVCYGVTNESYSTDWRPERWRLVLPICLVAVEVEASNGRADGLFLLEFDRSASPSIRLTLATEVEKSKVARYRQESERAGAVRAKRAGLQG